MTTPIEYIRAKGWEHQQQSGQIVVRTCPICGDEKGHFYMNSEDPGLWFCHKCQEKGNLRSLQKRFGDAEEKKQSQDVSRRVRPAFKKTEFKEPDQGLADKYHQALLKDSAGLDYLRSRGISPETADRFCLGLEQDKGMRWLSIPHFQKGRLLNIKFRSMPPAEKTFRRIPGFRSILFNADCLAGKEEIFITEGELDAITLVQAGIENVVSGTTGAGSFEAEWIDQLKNVNRVYLVYDPDEPGQQGARSLAKRLGYSRCLHVEMPEGIDVNAFFKGGGDVVDFRLIVDAAVRFDLPGVIRRRLASICCSGTSPMARRQPGFKPPGSASTNSSKPFARGI